MGAFDRPRMEDYKVNAGELATDSMGAVNRALQRYYADLFWWRVRMVALGIILWAALGLMVIGAGTVKSWFS